MLDPSKLQTAANAFVHELNAMGAKGEDLCVEVHSEKITPIKGTPVYTYSMTVTGSPRFIALA